MNFSVWFKSDTWDLERPAWVLVTCTFFAIGVVLTTAAKTAGAAAFFAVVPLLILLINGRKLVMTPVTPAVAISAVACMYIALSALWSADFFWSLKALTLAVSIVLAYWISQRVYDSLPVVWLEHMSRAVLVAFLVFLVYGLIEETLDHPIKRALFWPFQAITFGDGGLTINWDHVSRVRPRRTNWNMTNTSLLLWPLLVIARAHISTGDRRWFIPLVILATLATVLQAHHETAMIALCCGLAAYLLAQSLLRTMVLITAVGWLLIIASVVPLSSSALHNKLHLAHWVPYTMQHRVVLWGYTANQVPKQPILGVGAGSTHPLDLARHSEWRRIDGTVFFLQTGSHPHNIYLQVWYELGAIGAALLAALGAAILQSIVRRPREQAAAMLGGFVTVAVMSLPSFGLFELWYASAIAMTAMLFSLGVACRQRLTDPADGFRSNTEEDTALSDSRDLSSTDRIRDSDG